MSHDAYFVQRISEILYFSEKDANRMDRTITEISEHTGMSKTEIFEFIEYGAEKEIAELHRDFDWISFRKKIIKKIRPST